MAKVISEGAELGLLGKPNRPNVELICTQLQEEACAAMEIFGVRPGEENRHSVETFVLPAQTDMDVAIRFKVNIRIYTQHVYKVFMISKYQVLGGESGMATHQLKMARRKFIALLVSMDLDGDDEWK